MDDYPRYQRSQKLQVKRVTATSSFRILSFVILVHPT